MPTDVAPLITGDDYDPVIEIAADTETFTEASHEGTAVALGNRIEFIRRRVDSVAEHPELFVTVREDFMSGNYDATEALIWADNTWTTGIPAGSSPPSTAEIISGSPKNPGQLRVVVPGTDGGFYFTLGTTIGESVAFADFERATIVMSVVTDASNANEIVAFGLVEQRQGANGGADSLQVAWLKGSDPANWTLFYRKASAQTSVVLAPYVSGEFLVVDFIRTATGGLDVYADHVLVTTIAAANLPNDNGNWGGFVLNTVADPDPLIATFDLFVTRASIADRSGA